MIAPEIHEACRRFANDDPWWPDLLISTLEKRRPNLAFDWVKACMSKLLPLHVSEHHQELVSDLLILDAFQQSLPSVGAVAEKARSIWYRPNRDAAQTAMSHLYACVAELEAPVNRRIRAFAAPLDTLVRLAPDRDVAFKIVVERFADMVDRDD